MEKAKEILKWLAVLFAGLAAWFVDNETAAMGLLVMALTSVLALYAQWRGNKIGKTWAQVIVIGLSLLIGWFKLSAELNGSMPMFPDLSEPIVFLPALIAWLTSITVYFDRLVVVATVVYNLLWSKLQDVIAEKILKIPA